MIITHHSFKLISNGKRVTYHNVTEKIKKIVTHSQVRDGLIVVSSPHTTCSIIFEEYVHDKDWNGDELLQVDMNHVLERVIPRQFTESDYLYPGEKHVQFMEEISQDQGAQYPNDKTSILNADAHIKASLFGSSETFIIKNGKLLIGSVGYIYFIDWDQNRQRTRNCNTLIMGN